MKKAIITGASGMVGSLVLKECLDSAEIGRVISLVRKPTGITHTKLSEKIIPDFKDYSLFDNIFQNTDIAYYCIGVYTGQVPDKEFKEITVDYSIAFADALKKNSPDATLCFLSGAGADREEKNRMPFARYKGMAENYLLKTLENVYVFRSAYIYPVQKRKEPNFMYQVTRALYPVIRLFGKNMSIKSTELAKAIFNVGNYGTDKKILENIDIVRYFDEIN